MNKTILIKPLLTEKSMLLASDGRYTFQIDPRANKYEVAQAVTDQFSVEVERVRTHIRPGKPKRVIGRRQRVRTGKRKFAVVTLAAGASIPGFDQGLEVEEDA